MASLASRVVAPAADPRRTNPHGPPHEADWRAAMADAIRSPAELCRLLGLEDSVAAAAEQAAGDFPLLVPRTWLRRVCPGDPEDPLLVQVLPQAAEWAEVPGFVADPLGEAGATCRGGLLRKYWGRCVIVATPRCGVHCRFCFRRHFRGGPALAHVPEEDGSKEPVATWQPALDQVAADGSIREVILSGGDPLTLPDDELAQVAGRLAAIPHVRRLRVHTRLPVVIPRRVTDPLLGWLAGTRLAPVVVIHVNHPAEIDRSVAEALGRLVDAGIAVLSQSVLLRGVNDGAEVLAELCERLADLRVMPYYLHQLDRVAGAAHFEVPVPAGLDLIRQLRARLPGYAVPRYVREVPGEPGKRVLA